MFSLWYKLKLCCIIQLLFKVVLFQLSYLMDLPLMLSLDEAQLLFLHARDCFQVNIQPLQERSKLYKLLISNILTRLLMNERVHLKCT